MSLIDIFLFSFSDDPLFDIEFEDLAGPMDIISQQTDNEQFILRLDAIRIQFVHFDDGLDDFPAVHNLQLVLHIEHVPFGRYFPQMSKHIV